MNIFALIKTGEINPRESKSCAISDNIILFVTLVCVEEQELEMRIGDSQSMESNIVRVF